MRVGFFVHLPFHQPILEPIQDVVAARWLRSRLGVSRGLRRMLLPPLKACRLWLRGLTVWPAAPVEPLTRGGPGDG
jgi:hypothetical protein